MLGSIFRHIHMRLRTKICHALYIFSICLTFSTYLFIHLSIHPSMGLSMGLRFSNLNHCCMGSDPYSLRVCLIILDGTNRSKQNKKAQVSYTLCTGIDGIMIYNDIYNDVIPDTQPVMLFTVHHLTMSKIILLLSRGNFLAKRI